jgi:predicted transcriptional regulator
MSDFHNAVHGIVIAYIGMHPEVQIPMIPELITTVADSWKDFIEPKAPEPPVVVPDRRPAVSIAKSITPDYLICLDDGKKFKSLKRHLAALGMTPADYRAKWGLPADYPMVAPNYSAVRSGLAKANGLGKI